MSRDGQITMYRAEMDEGGAKLNELLASLQNTVDGMEGKFSVAMEAGFLGNSVSTISKQTASIGNSVTTIKNTINNKTNEMFDIDMKGAEKFDAIEVPTDFYANNDTETNEYNKVLVGKLDGKTVNDGTVTDSVDVHGDETTVDAVGLVDITGEAGKEHDRQHTNVEHEGIVDISVSGAQGVAVDAGSGIAKHGMTNINNGNAGDFHESGNANVVDANLVNVNHGVTANTANGGVTANVQGQSLAAIGGLAAVSQSAQADSIINSNNSQALSSAKPSGSKEEEIPVVNAATNASTAGPTSTKNAAVDFGAVAGLAGAVGLGLAGLAGSKEKEDEDKEESRSEDLPQSNREAVKEEIKDDKDHQNE